MPLVLVVLLAGNTLVADPPAPAAAGHPGGTRPAVRAAHAVPTGGFRAAPLELGRSVPKGPFRLTIAPHVGAAPDASGGDMGPEAPPRAECPLPVIKMGASFDPHFVVRLPSGPPDPIVRDELSGCGK